MPALFPNKKPGFTLVEIMIVVTIIALLAIIAIPNLLRAKLTANETMAKASLKAIGSALENYAVIHAVYPADTDVLVGDAPPYISKDFFVGEHSGYTFSVDSLSDYDYSVTAAPLSASTGSHTYVLTTGALITEM
ncbi:MAG TPA: type II secretion system protein [Candidatus Omnitrophota bacterium]|jgi:prepilin-type N-terminal cleavage/methylation domain-containing protein|nr:type II secretion system protein [Candidatus Omnitrophota bacterium]HSA31224.1 type II secretion system protein [Candidatus Omnitrophota bacterium]